MRLLQQIGDLGLGKRGVDEGPARSEHGGAGPLLVGVLLEAEHGHSGGPKDGGPREERRPHSDYGEHLGCDEALGGRYVTRRGGAVVDERAVVDGAPVDTAGGVQRVEVDLGPGHHGGETRRHEPAERSHPAHADRRGGHSVGITGVGYGEHADVGAAAKEHSTGQRDGSDQAHRKHPFGRVPH